MSVPQTQILRHDPDDVRRYSFDFGTIGLRSGDSVSSCAVAVTSGTATISPTTSSGATSCAATMSGNIATVFVLTASAGTVQLRWRATTVDGERLDATTALTVSDQ